MSTNCISNDEIEKSHGESELEVIMEAELEHKRRSSEVTAELKPTTTIRQRKQTVYDSSSQRSQE